MIHVSATPEGIPVLEVWHGDRKVTLYLERPISYVRVWGPDIHSQMADGEVGSPAVLAELFSWLTRVR